MGAADCQQCQVAGKAVRAVECREHCRKCKGEGVVEKGAAASAGAAGHAADCLAHCKQCKAATGKTVLAIDCREHCRKCKECPLCKELGAGAAKAQAV